MVSPQNVQGFLLLTIPNAKLSASFLHPPHQHGMLALECVTIAVPAQESPFTDGSQRDVWLVLRINNFELPISAADTIYFSRRNHNYTFQTPDGTIVITLPAPTTQGATEDLESLEVILAQYGILQSMDPERFGDDGDLKGRLVLVDEEDGNVVGTLGESFTVKEHPNMREPGREKDPIVVELPEDGQQEIHVHSVTPEEHDFILKSALFVSRGMVIATDLITKGMAIGTDYFVRNTTPNAQPIVFSEASQQNVRRIHKVSGQAVQVTAKTTGMIHSMVDKLSDRLAGKGKGPTGPPLPDRSRGFSSGSLPPPLPRREKSGLSSGRSSPVPMSGGYQPGGPPPLPPRKPRLLNRVLMGTDLLLTTLENSASTIAAHATQSASTALGHKYGNDMGEAAHLVGTTARNVGVVYIDARGVGRRALVKKVGKKAIRGRLGHDREVVFGEQVNADGSFSTHQDPWTSLQPPNSPPPRSITPGSQSRVPTYSTAPPGAYPGQEKKYY